MAARCLHKDRVEESTLVRHDEARGFALIDLLFVCGIIGVLSVIALPRVLLAKQSAGAASAIGSLRVINSSQFTFALTCGGGFYAPSLTVLGTAPPSSREAFITPSLATADTIIRSGYSIRLTSTAFTGSPGSCNGAAPGSTGQAFKAGADPTEPGNTRFFASNAHAQIFENTSSLFAAMPEVGDPAVGHLLR